MKRQEKLILSIWDFDERWEDGCETALTGL